MDDKKRGWFYHNWWGFRNGVTDWLDDWGWVLWVLLILVVVFGLVFGVPLKIAHDLCHDYAPQTGLVWKWDWRWGCLLNTSEGWMEYGDYMQSIGVR